MSRRAVPDPDESREPVLDDADRQSIREWFRRLARHRGPTDVSKTEMSKEAQRGQAADLFLPRELAADVKGGAASGAPAEPPDQPTKPTDD